VPGSQVLVEFGGEEELVSVASLIDKIGVRKRGRFLFEYVGLE
jgi:hypothetical protein